LSGTLRDVSERETAIARFHATHAGATSRGFARTGCYERLAAAVAPGERVLDLGCGDGHLLGLLRERGCDAAGIDLSADELRLARDPVVRGRAQQLPFADAAFDAIVCHLALALFDHIPDVLAECARVLVPGGRLAALVGGGPVADAPASDAFVQFLLRARFAPLGGDPRTRSEAGWRALLADWHDIAIERIELDAGGTFAEVWAFCLANGYGLLDPEAARAALHTAVGDRAACRAVVWLVTARR
jgi:SAM-dependent methyltransferase